MWLQRQDSAELPPLHREVETPTTVVTWAPGPPQALSPLSGPGHQKDTMAGFICDLTQATEGCLSPPWLECVFRVLPLLLEPAPRIQA